MIVDYEEMISGLILILFVIFVMCLIIFNFDKALTQEKQIIENTKEYTIFDNCKSFDNKYYCWNEKE